MADDQVGGSSGARLGAKAQQPSGLSRRQQRAEARWIASMRGKLHRERWLRCHVLLIAGLTLLALLLAGALLRACGVDSLAWRYAGALPLSYGVYLLLLRLWARYLLDREESPGSDAAELLDLLPHGSGRSGGPSPGFQSGGGGDFGGGGASGDFGSLDLAGSSLDGLQGAGRLLGKTGSALGDADEGAVVAVPLLIVLAIMALLAALLGVAVFALFGVEVLLGVALEVGLASWVGGMAYRSQRRGWLPRALGQTWKPALALLLLGVALGALIDHALPAADSLPQALQLLRKQLSSQP